MVIQATTRQGLEEKKEDPKDVPVLCFGGHQNLTKFKRENMVTLAEMQTLC